ncbi:MAG: SIS domain-containing protein [Acidimicrobiales bacterium]
MTDDGLLDSLDTFGALQLVPDAVRATLDAARSSGVPNDLDVGAVVVAASARSRSVAAAVEAVAASRLRCPLVTVVGGSLPSWVGPGALVLSLDGEVTERLVSDTTVAGVPVIGVGSGGPGTRPAPIVETVAALAALEQFGLVDGLIDELTAAAGHLDARLVELCVSRSPAERLARRIGHTMVLAYGAGPVGAAAAFAWKTSVNRNAKVPAFANSVPGLDHDEVVGWAQHGDVTRQVFTLVMLRHAFETADEARRMDVTAETCEEIVADVLTVTSEAASPAAVLLDLMLYGEMASLEMAVQADVDPGPTPIVERYR